MSPYALKNAQQIPLDLGARSAQGRDDFQVGKSNKAAVGWLDRWPEWSAPILILQGPAASGKTHLATVWKEKANARAIAPQNLKTIEASDLFDLGDALLIDGLDPWLGDREAETTLFHLYNMLKEEQKTMMITMRMTATTSDFVLPDLASRFRAAPSVSIHAPDDMLLGSILIKLFSDRQQSVNNDVLSYILPRMERSFAAARDIVERADKKALSLKSRITIPVMRKVLADMQGE